MNTQRITGRLGKTLEDYAAELVLAQSEVRHIDRDPRNTAPSNLYVTPKAGIEVPLAYLRWSDHRMVGAIARGGGPLYAGDLFHLYCPVCGCRKSGHVEEPNGRDGDVCDLYECRCHDDETDIEYQTCIDHPDRPAVAETSVQFPFGLNRWVPVCDGCRQEWADPEHTRALSW